jgi:pyrroline-5-carboxylate reductase
MSDAGNAASAGPTAMVGCGNLGIALLERAVRTGALDPARTIAIDPDERRRAQARALGVRAEAALDAAVGVPQLVLAVKPQAFADVAARLSPTGPTVLAISVMAGWSAASISTMLGGSRVVRAMPNTPARIGLGFTCVAAGTSTGAGEQDLAVADRLFSAVGRTARIDESRMDAATAMVGSAPAYLFLLAEAQVEAAERMGIDPALARSATAQTMLGAATLLAADGADAATLRAEVTSPRGTTAAAIDAFERAGLRAIVAEAMDAARARAQELGR